MPDAPPQPAPKPAAAPSDAGPAPASATMRAVTRRRYGGIAELAVETPPRPEPGPGEVLIKVGAAGLDRGTCYLMEGTPYVARLAFGLRRPRDPKLGMEVAGEVVAVGADVAEYAVGQRVFGVAAGAFAQYAVAKPAQLAATPDAVDDIRAATLGISGTTALQALAVGDGVRPGQRVLVIGASGGVGSFCVQLATLRGAQVTAVCSGAKGEFVRGLGATEVCDYRATPLTALAPAFDLVIDIAGNRPLAMLRSVLAPSGTLVIVGGDGGGPVLGGLERNLAANVVNPFVRQRLTWIFGRTTTASCAELASLVARGELRPAVDRTVRLDEAAEAMEAMLRGELRGKAVICP